MIRVVLADDHPLVREGCRKLIDETSEMCVVAECGDGTELLAVLAQTECDVVVLDLKMPGRSGLELLTEMAGRVTSPRVLALSMYPEEEFALRALRAGASGFLSKETAPEELLKAIKRIHGGGKYISQAVAELLANELDSERETRPHDRLSNREFEVFQLIGSGRSVGDISAALSLSVNTVNTYRRRILQKMRLHNNADLIRYTIQNELVV